MGMRDTRPDCLSRWRRTLAAALLWGATIFATGIAWSQEGPSLAQLLSGSVLPDAEVRTLEHTEALYPHAVVKRGKAVRPLPYSSRKLGAVSFSVGGVKYDLFDYMAQNRVAGLLVIKDGKIAFEDYELGATAQTKWASFSMAKSVSSTLLAIALRKGLIQSIDDPVTRYLPELAGSAYDGVTLRNLLQMASGVRWDETYTDPNSDCRRLADAQLTYRAGASVNFMRTLTKAGPPGSVWNYNSGEINLVGAVIERASGTSLASFLSANLWSRLGMESDATWWVESPGGMGLGGVGLSATLRDYGRFGLFVEQGGVVDGQQLVPDGWLHDATAAHVIGDKRVDYGYLWWPVPSGDPVHDGAFQAKGIFGQRMYINPKEKLVIVALSARSKPTGASPVDDLAFFAAVAKSLQ